MKPQTWRIGRKVYGICLDCGSTVRINKPIIGDLHVCVDPKEKEKR